MKPNSLKYSFPSLVLMSALISFLGWLVENIWIFLTKGYINNRNMFLPFLLGYGLFILVLYLILGTPDTMGRFNNVAKNWSKLTRFCLYALVVMLGVSICEIGLGYFVENTCGFEYWNYSNIPLHFTKYTSVPTSMAFAVMITFFMEVCLPLFMQMLGHIPAAVCKGIAYPIGILMIMDYLISFGIMLMNGSTNKLWQIQLR